MLAPPGPSSASDCDEFRMPGMIKPAAEVSTASDTSDLSTASAKLDQILAGLALLLPTPPHDKHLPDDLHDQRVIHHHELHVKHQPNDLHDQRVMPAISADFVAYDMSSDCEMAEASTQTEDPVFSAEELFLSA